MKKQSWRINSGAPRQTLQAHLTERLQISRGQAKALLDRRGVFINGRRVWMARHPLRPGDLVELTDTAATPPRHAPKTLFDEAGLLIIDKPPGINTNGADSLETLLRRELARPALTALHRLDCDTTGCLMFGEGAALREKTIKLFAEHRVVKVYHAIVGARPDFKQRDVSIPVDGQPAVSRMRVLDANPESAHLQIAIETGRTHQIRRHLAGLHLPLLGERQYGGGRRLTPRAMRVPRQMLHARRLILPHPVGGAPVNVEAPLPADFRRILAMFGLR